MPRPSGPPTARERAVGFGDVQVATRESRRHPTTAAGAAGAWNDWAHRRGRCERQKYAPRGKQSVVHSALATLSNSHILVVFNATSPGASPSSATARGSAPRRARGCGERKRSTPKRAGSRHRCRCFPSPTPNRGVPSRRRPTDPRGRLSRPRPRSSRHASDLGPPRASRHLAQASVPAVAGHAAGRSATAANGVSVQRHHPRSIGALAGNVSRDPGLLGCGRSPTDMVAGGHAPERSPMDAASNSMHRMDETSAAS